MTVIGKDKLFFGIDRIVPGSLPDGGFRLHEPAGGAVEHWECPVDHRVALGIFARQSRQVAGTGFNRIGIQTLLLVEVEVTRLKPDSPVCFQRTPHVAPFNL
ncbi:MAG: hypothetical protein HY674_13100 [Chloroflexi bacterium]|nr:hypothetical protein [Chloroflexota bacterium]